MAKLKTLFECEACGNQQSKWMGKCPQCGAWESFIELSNEQIKASQELAKLTKTTKNATPISQIQIEQIKRKSTGDNELDLVLGGGVVSGSLVLIGGSPGIGKSTLLLKIASNLLKKSDLLLKTEIYLYF